MQISAILKEIQRVKGWTQSELGRALGVDQSTVSRWYRGSKPDTEQRDRITALARRTGVLGASEQPTDFWVPIVGHVGAGGHILYSEGQGPFGEARMPPQGAKATTVAVIVRGDSMSGQLEDGWTVYYDTRREPPTPDLHGKLCVVGLPGGEVYIKRLLPGSRPGTFHLLSVNASPLLDQVIDWAAKVAWIAPV